MVRILLLAIAYLSSSCLYASATKYPLGCEDPAYQEYIAGRFATFEERSRRAMEQTWREYELSLLSTHNPYGAIANLSRHIVYSAQFEPVEQVQLKIDQLFEHTEALTPSQQIAGGVVDNFSSENHSVRIARAWIAYRNGHKKKAFDELLKSIDVTESANLRVFGPDFHFVRYIYNEGHGEPVVAYLEKTKSFWTGRRPNELRAIWFRMIDADCKLQFDSMD